MDKEVADRTVRDAWNLSSSALDNDGRCDFNTMAMWTDTDHFSPLSGEAIDEEKRFDQEVETAKIMDTNENVANKQQGSMKGNVFGCAELLSWEK